MNTKQNPAPPAPDEADQALAQQVARSLFRREPLIINGMRILSPSSNPEVAHAHYIEAALAQARKETWERAVKDVWKTVFDVVSNEAYFGARQLVKELEVAREKDFFQSASKQD